LSGVRGSQFQDSQRLREAMNDQNCNNWFDTTPEAQRLVLTRLRSLIFEVVPGAVEELKWSRPCYSSDHGLFCYLHSTKKHATLGFQNGASLSDPKKQLEGDGKDMRHIKLRSINDIDEPYFRKLLSAAAAF